MDPRKSLLLEVTLLLTIFIILISFLIASRKKRGQKKRAAEYLPDFVLEYDKKKARHQLTSAEKRGLFLRGFVCLAMLAALFWADVRFNPWMLFGYGVNDQIRFLLEPLIVWFAAIWLNVAVHELGHVLFGLFTGFRFVSVRLMHVGLKKQNGKYRLFFQKIRYLGGETVMMPPDGASEKVRLLPYYWGGVVMNGAAAVGSLVWFLLSANDFVRWVALTFAIIAAEMVVINSIPYCVPGLQTDGMQIMAFSESPAAKDAHVRNMRIAAASRQGIKTVSIGEENFLPVTAALLDRSPFAVNALYVWIRLLGSNRFTEARAVGVLLPAEKTALPVFQKAMIGLSNLYMDLLLTGQPQDLGTYLTDEQKLLLKKTDCNVYFALFKHGYELLYKHDPVAAAAARGLVKKMQNKDLSMPAGVELDALIRLVETRGVPYTTNPVDPEGTV